MTKKEPIDIHFLKIIRQLVIRYRIRVYILLAISLFLVTFSFVPYINVLLSMSIVFEVFLICFFLLLPLNRERIVKLVLLLFFINMILSLLGKSDASEILGNSIYFLLVKTVILYITEERKLHEKI